MAQYGGPLLDGFHLGGEGEFDRWIERERGRLAGRYAQALRAMASAADQRGDPVAAAEYLQRLSALDPLDSQVVLQLMEVLERAGNGAVALRHARMHQTLRHTDLGLGGDPSVSAAEHALVSRLARARAIGASAEPVTEVTAIAVGAGASVTATGSSTQPDRQPDTEPLPDRVPVTPAPQRTASRRTRFLLGAGAIAASAFALAVARYRPAVARSDSPPVRGGDSATASVVPGVAVFPFLVRGSDSSAFTGASLAALIATKLDGGTGMRSIEPDAILARSRPGTENPDPVDAARLARSLGARYFVLGDVMRISGQLSLGAAMYDATDGRPVDARISVQGVSSGFFELVDSLAMRLLVEQQGQPASQFERLASLTTGSLPALKLFIEGESFLRAGKYEAAAERYERATVADSTFALGYYRLARARSWRGGRLLDEAALELAARHGARLPERIRQTLAALQTVAHGDFERGVEMLFGVIERYPDDFDANLWFGDVLYRLNPSHGRSIAEARAPLERASVLAPTRSADALFHLIELAAHDGRMHDLDSLSTLLLALNHESDVAPTVRTIVAVAHGDSSRLAVARRELGGMSALAAVRVISVVNSLAMARANHVTIANLLESLPTPYPANERGVVLHARAQLAGVDGDWGVADSLFDLAAAAKFEDATFIRGRFLSLVPLDPPPAMMRGAIADLHALAVSKPIDRGWAELFAAMLALRLGDTMPAAVALPRAVATAKTDDYIRELTVELSARRLLAIGKPDEAMTVLLSPGGSLPGVHQRYLRGEVLEALHRPKEALIWYDASEQEYGFFSGAEWYSAAVARAHRRLDRR
jgi:tetratricopeptide (TPR) repeat protein